jgi:hypothetical protein
MNKLTITITITDLFLLEIYKDTLEEIIAEDFVECPAEWLDGAEIEVEKE